MNKKAGILLATLGAFVLLGAGCNNNQPATDNQNQNGNDTTTPTTTTGNNDQSGFGLTVEAMGSGVVKVSWTVPSDLDKNASIRVLHSGRPNSDKPFWSQYMNSTREAEVRNVPTGSRYFKVCEWKDNNYGKCSNETEAEVN